MYYLNINLILLGQGCDSHSFLPRQTELQAADAIFKLRQEGFCNGGVEEDEFDRSAALAVVAGGADGDLLHRRLKVCIR